MKITTNCKDFKYYSNINCEELKNIACRAMLKLGSEFQQGKVDIEDERDIPYYLDEIIDDILCEYCDETYDWEIIKEYSSTSSPLRLNDAKREFVKAISEYVEIED